jgi:MOSC domain-containing protein YiiM
MQVDRQQSKSQAPYLYQINISNGGVPKLLVPEAHITSQGVVGDRQRNRDVHGGIDRAVCLFSLEVIQALQAEGHVIEPGASGENLTIAGVDWSSLKPGGRVHIGRQVSLEITSYTAPCTHNARWFVNGDFSRISQKLHPGWSRLYARVLTEGMVRPGDAIVAELETACGKERLA